MWLKQPSGGIKGASPACAGVTHSAGGYVNASGDADQRDVPMFLPYGICSVPCEGEKALLLPLDGSFTYVGTLCTPAMAMGLLQGELRLTSHGGAQITLKNNGEVIINGLVIKPDGSFAVSGVNAL